MPMAGSILPCHVLPPLFPLPKSICQRPVHSLSLHSLPWSAQQIVLVSISEFLELFQLEVFVPLLMLFFLEFFVSLLLPWEILLSFKYTTSMSSHV